MAGNVLVGSILEDREHPGQQRNVELDFPESTGGSAHG